VSATLVVLAAGIGSRFGGMKQVAELGPSGESLFDYAVYDGVRAGFDKVVFVISEASRQPVNEHVERGCARHVTVSYAEQEFPSSRKKPWGTGHAVLTACPEVEGDFSAINADDFYGRRSFEILGEELGADDDDHVLVGFQLRKTLSPYGGVSRGMCIVEDGVLKSIIELHEVQEVDGAIRCKEGLDLTGDELISANLWGFRLSFCRVLSAEFERFAGEHASDSTAEFLIGDAVDRLADHGAGRVRVVPTPEPLVGVTYADDVPDVRRILADLVARGEYPTPLWG